MIILSDHDWKRLQFGHSLQVSQTRSGESPYVQTTVLHLTTTLEYNPEYGDARMCMCGHPYVKHFDLSENTHSTPCKWCTCEEFVEA